MGIFSASVFFRTSEKDGSHFDGLPGRFGTDGPAHEGFVRIAHGGQHHFGIAPRMGHIVGLGHHTAGDVQAPAGVGQFDKVGVVFKGGVSAAPIQVMDERRAVAGDVGDVVTADGHMLFRVARLQGVF
jgi:hypothetical protein